MNFSHLTRQSINQKYYRMQQKKEGKNVTLHITCTFYFFFFSSSSLWNVINPCTPHPLSSFFYSLSCTRVSSSLSFFDPLPSPSPTCIRNNWSVCKWKWEKKKKKEQQSKTQSQRKSIYWLSHIFLDLSLEYCERWTGWCNCIDLLVHAENLFFLFLSLAPWTTTFFLFSALDCAQLKWKSSPHNKLVTVFISILNFS